MVANIRHVVTGTAGSQKNKDATGKETTCGHIVVDTGYARDVDGLGIEDGLSPRNGRPRRIRREPRPSVKGVEDRGRELSVTRRYQSAWLLKLREQKMNAGIDADEEWLSGEGYRSAGCAVRIHAARVIVDDLRCG